MLASGGDEASGQGRHPKGAGRAREKVKLLLSKRAAARCFRTAAFVTMKRASSEPPSPDADR